ncbi:hypothetical protein [Mariniluteicoccus endophyticus]
MFAVVPDQVPLTPDTLPRVVAVGVGFLDVDGGLVVVGRVVVGLGVVVDPTVTDVEADFVAPAAFLPVTVTVFVPADTPVTLADFVEPVTVTDLPPTDTE